MSTRQRAPGGITARSDARAQGITLIASGEAGPRRGTRISPTTGTSSGLDVRVQFDGPIESLDDRVAQGVDVGLRPAELARSGGAKEPER